MILVKPMPRYVGGCCSSFYVKSRNRFMHQSTFQATLTATAVSVNPPATAACAEEPIATEPIVLEPRQLLPRAGVINAFFWIAALGPEL